MKYLSLFSGIEAATQAWHPLGWECVAVSEIEPFPCAVLAHHYPDVPNLGDVTRITEQDIAALGQIDLVVFGSPCQDLSVAGHRKGLINADGTVTRSGLFFTAVNIFQWARKHCGARFALWENVPGAFSSNKGRDFGAVVEFMAGLDEVPVPPKGWGLEGVAVGDNGLLEWATLDAQWFGVAQRRRRVFALLDTGDWAGRPPILLEPESVRGDSAPSRETRKETAGTIMDGTFECGGTGRYRSSSSSPLLKSGSDLGPGCEALITQHHIYSAEVVSALCAADGVNGVGQQYVNAGNVIAMSSGQANAEITHGHAPTLNCPHEAPVVCVPDPAYAIAAGSQGKGGVFGSGRDGQDTFICVTGSATHALRADGFDATQITSPQNGNNPKYGDHCHPRAAAGHTPTVAYPVSETAISMRESGKGYGVEDDKAGTLRAEGENRPSRPSNVIKQGMQVRRLTPVECARLQGFPDRFLDIPYRNKPAADGPKYKALGNSMAVPVMHWIGMQVQRAVDMQDLI